MGDQSFVLEYQSFLLPPVIDVPPSMCILEDVDSDQMLKEVHDFELLEWRPQQSTMSAKGRKRTGDQWTVVSLRSPGGRPDRTDPGGPGFDEYHDTPAMRSMPSIRAFVESLSTAIAAVRLMCLASGASIHGHEDSGYGFEHGRIRLHVPLVTNEGATLTIDDTQIHWPPGKLWFGNFKKNHHGMNEGTTGRIHLVIDLDITKRFVELLPEAVRENLPVHQFLVSREDIPLPLTQLSDFQGTIRLLNGWLYGAEDLDREGSTVDVDVRLLDDQLVLVTDGEPLCALVHVGGAEFRLAGWTIERTLRLPTNRAGHTSEAVQIVRKGSQEIARPTTMTGLTGRHA